MSRRHDRHRHEAVELNITAFMNLMVILVPFLLITAVFSQVAILELNLPSSSDQPGDDPVTPQLEVIVRHDRLEVGERNAGLLTGLPVTADGYDFDGLNDYLKRIKAKFPDKIDASILLESEIPYEVLVKVMDAVRIYEATGPGADVIQAELFPEISIGDAPVRKTNS
ncbi:MAG: biopolymer transporter ExbD [Gammaproteobacteria bacterium]|jgi:biopolymer transport protein ExbD|nr:biopolymer transporter ExbD [Gammaproteobacteria bacterium]